MENYTEDHYKRCIQSLFDNNIIYKSVFIDGSNINDMITFIAKYFQNSNCKDYILSQSLQYQNPSFDILAVLERSYGIPDDVFPKSDIFEERLKYLNIKRFCSLVGVWQKSDFVYLANLLGITDIKFESYTELYDVSLDSTLDIDLYNNPANANYHWIIHLSKDLNEIGLDYDLDYTLESSSNVNVDILRKLILKLKRSHVEVEFLYDL